MRVFILCTGRSGSAAIIKACKHVKNYSSSHESLTKEFGKKRFDYPENHIESDNRLSWHLGCLHKLYGDEAFYVHLKRNTDDVAQSLLKRFYRPRGIMDAFCDGIRRYPSVKLSPEMRLQACYDYIDTVDSNIEHFLSDKSNIMTLKIERIKEDFPVFWKRIGAKGNIEDALNVFDKRHNTSKKRSLNFNNRLKLILIGEWRHILMWIKS